MKSIREKAKEYGILNFNIHYDTDGNTYNDIDKPSMDFEAGANYVINCIEKEILSCKEFSQSQLRLIMQFCEQLEVTNK